MAEVCTVPRAFWVFNIIVLLSIKLSFVSDVMRNISIKHRDYLLTCLLTYLLTYYNELAVSSERSVVFVILRDLIWLSWHKFVHK